MVAQSRDVRHGTVLLAQPGSLIERATEITFMRTSCELRSHLLLRIISQSSIYHHMLNIQASIRLTVSYLLRSSIVLFPVGIPGKKGLHSAGVLCLERSSPTALE